MGYRNTHRLKTGAYQVFVGSRCSDPHRCRIPRLRVHYHEDYDACTSEDDIAVLELTKNVPRHWATPICLPDREETISDDLKAAGSGWRVCQITSLFHFDTEANVQKKGVEMHDLSTEKFRANETAD
ncbi:hypothetical protein COOONC_02398 [Cooperia oncophora]